MVAGQKLNIINPNLQMKYSKTCNYCGHKITAYTIFLNSCMVAAFCKFTEKYLTRYGASLKKGEIGLSNAQYTNFQNLRHFGIIQQFEKGGRWYLTSLGKNFYFGKSGVTNPAGHLDGETLEYTHEAWKTHDKPRKLTYIDSFLPHQYKQRTEYQEEKNSKQMNLL